MIVVTGEALVDLLIDPDGGVRSALGGGPFNAARTVARLGRRCGFYGAISTDRFGTLLQRQLAADGVDTAIIALTDLPTTLAAAELDEHGAASYHFYVEGTSAPALPATAMPADLRFVHVGTLGLVLEPMATVTERMLEELPKSIVVLVDLNCRPRIIADRVGYLARVERVLAHADIVKVSTDDLGYLMGVEGEPSEQEIGAYRDRLLSFGPTVVLHTDGGRSAWVCHRGSAAEVPVPRVEVVDTVGAGDAFGGAFIARWDQLGLGRVELADPVLVRSACEVAVHVAASTCGRVGADPPWASELGSLWSA